MIVVGTHTRECRLRNYGCELRSLVSPRFSSIRSHCFQVNAYGVFELRLKSFVNEYGKDSLGKCCSGSASKTGECSGVCKTKFRVCLKEYQVKIDTTTECTYGDVVTPVLGENIVNFSPNVAMPSFTNPIRFPFNFRWPVSVSCTPRALRFNLFE